MTIGERIKSAREAAGITQQQLADAVQAGGGQRQVSNWEVGLRTPRRETLEKIAAALGVKASWLMFGE
jgi:transcriptional regulator with XRE-family HTH domain